MENPAISILTGVHPKTYPSFDRRDSSQTHMKVVTLTVKSQKSAANTVPVINIAEPCVQKSIIILMKDIILI